MLTELAAATALVLARAEPAKDGSGCAVVNSIGQCLVAAVDPGRPGGPRGPEKKPSSSGTKPRPPAKAASKPAAGQSPAGIRAPGVAIPPRYEQEAIPRTAQQGVPPRPAPAVPTPAQLIGTLTRSTVERLNLYPPALHTSAGAEGLVGVPVWLWLDDAQTAPVTTTATAGAARVTATARLTSVMWSMGPPGGEVHCAGPGTPWNGQEGRSPDCGYTYTQRSLPERTDGSGQWTITATCTWTVTFSGASASAPIATVQTVDVPTTTTLAVGEVQVLVGKGES